MAREKHGRHGLESRVSNLENPAFRHAGCAENEGWGATVCCVDLTVLPEDFLGRNYDRAFVNDLPPGVDPFGENGEFHTFVHTAPGFSARVGLATGQRRLTHSGQFLTLELNPA